jgi:hypothetical protein
LGHCSGVDVNSIGGRRRILGYKITFTPTRHFSGRGLNHKSLWEALFKTTQKKTFGLVVIVVMVIISRN